MVFKKKEENSTTQVTPKNKGGRPRKDTGLPKDPTKQPGFVRQPLTGLNSKLKLLKKDPNWYTLWVKDYADNGHELERHKRAGFMFVSPTEGYVPSSQFDSRMVDGTTIIKIPETDGGWMYLMKQPMWAYNEDHKMKQESIDRTEKALLGYQDEQQSVRGLKSSGSLSIEYK